MNFKNKAKKLSELFTLRGSFGLVDGELTSTENGYAFSGEGVRLTSELIAHPSGVCRRRDVIKNISEGELTVRSALSKFVFNGGEYRVYTQHSFWCGERFGGWQPLVTEVCASNDDIRHNTGAAPFVAIYNTQNRRGVAFHLLCDGKWRFRVRKFYSQSGQRKNVTVELGLDDSDLELKLAAGEELELPVVLCYEFESKTDMDAFKLHRYCNDTYPKPSLPVIYNSWMSSFDRIGFEVLSRQLEIAERIGVEYFVIDAGWFGRPDGWFDSVGDWEECTEYSMCGRMAEFADKVRERGLKFGLWFEIERASLNSRAYNANPQYYIVEDGQAFLDFANPDACAYMLDILTVQIERYGIEFIKFDFNATLTYDPERLSFSSYFKGYRGFIRALRERYPSLYLENCASGGMRMALANLDGFDSFWTSDDHSLYSQLEIFKSTVLRMPPRALEKWLTLRSLAPFEPTYHGDYAEKILMCGDAGWEHIEAINESYLRAVAVGGPIGISCDLTRLSPTLLDSLAQLIAEHKAERDFWAGAECRILCNTPSLTALQYNDVGFERIKIFTFSALPVQNAVTLYPAVATDAEYLCSSGESYSSAALTEDGIDLPIGNRYTAQSVTLVKK